MRIISLTAIALVFAAATASAGIFGPSDEEIQNTVKAYFNKPAATLADFQGLDLAILKDNKDAYVLSVHLKRQLNAAGKALEAEEAKLDTLETTVERYFVTLYRKELHDEFWSQVRPQKQAAYRDALAAARAQEEKVRAGRAVLEQGHATLDILKRIADEFKEIAPPSR